MPGGMLTCQRFFFFIFFVLVCTLAARLDVKLNFSKITFWFATYVVFALLNRFAQTETINAHQLSVMVSSYIFPLIFLFLIDNLYFDEKDLNLLIKILTIVAIGTFVASFIQATIDPFFYKGIQPTAEKTILSEMERIYGFGEISRNYSIYRGMRLNNHGIAMICLTVLFSWLYCSKKNVIYLIIVGLLIFSGFVTYSRYVWLGIFLAVISVFYFGYRKRWIVALGLLSFCSVLVVHLYYPQFVTSGFVEQRILSETYKSRINDPILYLTEFFPHKPFFGYGIGSDEHTEFTKHHSVLHSMWFNVMFRNGIIGLSFLIVFLYHIYKRGKQIYEVTGNPLFIIFVLIYIIINFTASYTELDFYGYYFILLLMSIHYQLYVVDVCRAERNAGEAKKPVPHLPDNA